MYIRLKSFVLRGTLFLLRVRELNSFVFVRFEILLHLFGCENYLGP